MKFDWKPDFQNTLPFGNSSVDTKALSEELSELTENAYSALGDFLLQHPNLLIAKQTLHNMWF